MPDASSSVSEPVSPSVAPGLERSEESTPATRTDGPTYLFFGIVSAVALLADVASKAWAEITLNAPGPDRHTIVLIEEHLSFALAYNRGGAWGLFHDASEAIRRPFFLGVSVAAVVFIVSLYSRLTPEQRALKWGLPLVLGGALGNLADRIVRSSVVDFIDYRADWIETMNRVVAKVASGWNVTSHWPTFNVADMCICAGVALMAIDMITSKGTPPPRETEEDSDEALSGGHPLPSSGEDRAL